MALKGIIIDDDAYIREELEMMISTSFRDDIELLGTFAEPQLGLDFIRKNGLDLIFLDIFMPGMTGFDLLDHLGSTNNAAVIFITSYNGYAIKAIKYSALDYLLKPVKIYDLKAAIVRLKEKSERQFQHARISNLRYNLLAENDASMQLVLGSKQGERRFQMKDIIRCEADSNYTLIHMNGNKKFMASKTLGEIGEMLSESQFLRVHKSHLVNPEYIDHITDAYELVLKEESRIPISRRRASEVKRFLKK
jgi:two-component system LytT family response regulator